MHLRQIQIRGTQVWRLRWLAALLVLGFVLGLSIWPVNAQARLTLQSRVAIDGIGPIRVGMTIAEAERSANIKLVQKWPPVSPGCYNLVPQSGFTDLAFMATGDPDREQLDPMRDQIARVEVYGKSPIKTFSGAGIGDSEARIKSLYPGRIQVKPHPYTAHAGGKYLIFAPKDAADRNYQVIFETDKGRVSQFRAGRLPEVGYIEGCA